MLSVTLIWPLEPPIDISPSACKNVLMSALHMMVGRKFVEEQKGDGSRRK